MRYTGEDGKVFHVDVASAPVPQDITTMRMNIDNFDEAYNMLLDKGFKNSQGEKVTETPSSKSTMMIAPSGFPINITQHIKKDS